MARRRMFSLDIIDTDLFQEMPQTSRLLYYELCMRADDDGFVGSPKKIQRMVGCSDDDFKVLIAKQFIIPFETGIVVIKHWKVHNYIRNDRYKQTIYIEEKSQLKQDENGMYTIGIPNGYQMDTQVRLGKDSIGKDIKENIKRKGKKEFLPPTLEEIESYVKEKGLNVNAKQFYDYFSEGNWVDAKGNKVKSWKQKILTWNSYAKPKQKEETDEERRERKIRELKEMMGNG